MGDELDADRIREIDAACEEWRQGDLVLGGWIAHLAKVDEPLSDEPREGAVASDVQFARNEVEGLVVVTQSCDLLRTCAANPFVLVAPLVRLEGNIQREAELGTTSRFAPVPSLGPDAFADLDRILTIEKAILVTWNRVQGLRSDDEERKFSRAIGRRYSRFAFPNDLAMAIGPFVKRIREKHDKLSDEGVALRSISQIRVSAAPSWDAGEILVFLLFITADDPDSEIDWDHWLGRWVGLCAPYGIIKAIDGEVFALDELTARQYEDTDRLDLDHLSER